MNETERHQQRIEHRLESALGDIRSADSQLGKLIMEGYCPPDVTEAIDAVKTALTYLRKAYRQAQQRKVE